MENYLKFTLPEFIDISMLIMWLCVGVVALGLLFFILWKKEKPRNIYPRLTTIFGVLGIIGIPVILLAGQYLNETKLIDSIETNYGVEVVSREGERFLISAKGNIHPCTIHQWQGESYYALCDVPSGRLLLNDVVADAD